MVDVYARVAMVTRLALADRRSDFVERCVTLMVWLARRHGPHEGRAFPIDRRSLPCARIFQDEAGKPLLTEDMIRTALAALRKVGLIAYAAEQRWKNAFRRFADVYRLGERISTLFPNARGEAPSASNSPVDTPREERVSRDPLVRGSCKSVLPRPFQRILGPKTMVDLLIAKAEEVARGIQPLSPLALRTLGLTSSPAAGRPAARGGLPPYGRSP